MFMGVFVFLVVCWDKGGDGFIGGDLVIVVQVMMQIFLVIENFVVVCLLVYQVDVYFEEIVLNVESYFVNYFSDDCQDLQLLFIVVIYC